MINYRIVQLLLLISSMTSQVIGMVDEKKEIGEGIARRIEELPKELKYKILLSALALREKPKYEVYRKFDLGSKVKEIALTKDNTRALIEPFHGETCIWDVEKGKIIKELKEHTSTIVSVALSADGILALTGYCDEIAGVWNMNTGELLKTLQVGSIVYSVALSADGTLALTGSGDGIARLYHTSTGELLKELKGHTELILSMALSADGTVALTGSNDGTARVWNTGTGETITLFKLGSLVNSVALNADGTIALTSTGNNNKALVWDAQSGALLNTLLTTGLVYSVVLSKDGKRALTGTKDNKIQVWDIKPLPGSKETNAPLTVLEGHTNPVYAVAFGGEDFIASCSLDKTALIWKPFALEPRGPQEHVEVLRQAYKETFSRPKFLFPDEK